MAKGYLELDALISVEDDRQWPFCTNYVTVLFLAKGFIDLTNFQAYNEFNVGLVEFFGINQMWQMWQLTQKYISCNLIG